MTHVTTDLPVDGIIRLVFNMGVEDISLLSGEEMTASDVYLVFLNGQLRFNFFTYNYQIWGNSVVHAYIEEYVNS